MQERKPLGVLQNTIQTKLSFSGKPPIVTSFNKKRLCDENQSPMKPGRKDEIYEDPPTPSTKRLKLATVDASAQTNLSCMKEAEASASSSSKKAIVCKKDAKSLMNMLASEEPTKEYWEMLALERKTALKHALAENKKLHEKVSELQGEVHQLREDNTLLEDMLQEAKQLAELVQSVTNPANEEASTDAQEESNEDAENEELAQPLPLE